MQTRETDLSCILIVKGGFGHIYEKSKCTAQFALIFRLKLVALGVGTNNLIKTSHTDFRAALPAAGILRGWIAEQFAQIA